MRRCLILYGLTCIIGQVLSLRELSVVFHGNELVYGVALAVWLLTFAVGSGLLGRLSGKYSLGVPTFVAALAGAGLLAPVTILLARCARYVMVGGAGVTPGLGGVFLATLVVLIPLCLVLGFFYALACSIASRGSEPAAVVATRMYVFEAMGTFFGGALLTYALLDVLDAFQIALAVAGINCLAAFVVWWHSPRHGRSWGWALLPASLVFAAGLISPAGKIADLLSQAPRFPGRVLRSSADTPYGRVDVAEAAGQMEFYQSGSLVGATHMDRSAEETAFLALLSHPAPRRALILGGLVNGVVRKALELPWLRVDYVELDPALVEAARRYADLKDRAAMESPRLKLFANVDARLLIKRMRNRYDVIISALPNPSTGLINRFYTAEFFAEARRALTPNGVLALGLDGAPTYMSAPHRSLAASLYATLRSAFGSAAVLPGDNGIYYFASSGRSASFPDTALWPARMRAWQMRPAWLTEGTLREMARPDRAARLAALLAADKTAPRNTDLRPVAYYQSLLLWAEAFQVKGTMLLSWALRLDLWSALFAIAVLTGLLAIGTNFASQRLRVGLSATRVYAGMAGFVLEMVLVFAFQSMYGYAYGQLGILFAAFMVGLTAGALVAGGYFAAQADVRVLAVLQLSLAVLAAAFVPILYLLERSGPWGMQAGAVIGIPFLNFCIGALVGAQYPISVAAWSREDGPDSEGGGAAAGLYALELLGASVGALIGGAILIPVLGIPSTCWAMCALSLASLPLLILGARRRYTSPREA